MFLSIPMMGAYFCAHSILTYVARILFCYRWGKAEAQNACITLAWLKVSLFPSAVETRRYRFPPYGSR